jgi:hypothetical protein
VYAARAEAESARASALAEKGGFAEAERVLRAVAADGEKAPVQAPTTWLRTGLAWLRWADGDPKGAIADVEQSARDAAAAHYMGNMSVLMEEERQHDIAMMWCEILAAGPVSEKARARQHLKTARSAFSEAAGMIGDGHATAGLAALCAVRSRDRKAAQAAVHLAETSAPPFGNPTRDPDLYAFGLAYDLLGEHAKADEARSKIGGGVVGFALRRRIAEEASKKNAP